MNARADFGAWVPPRGPMPEPAPNGPLAGLTFAIKDNFAIAGRSTRAGCPDWARDHIAARVHASALERLLRAGARCLGQTVMDELAYGIEGMNVHDGTPDNPAAPGRVCGGSSCGSAAAVAGGLVDFALGTDTAGSIRVPASWTGLWGFRPTHGSVAIDGVTPLAPSFDTVGWLARDGDTLARVGEILLPAGEARGVAEHTLLVLEDALELLPSERTMAVLECIERIAPRFAGVSTWKIGAARLAELRHAMRILQADEVREGFSGWLLRSRPKLAPWIAERFAATLAADASERSAAQAVREQARVDLGGILKKTILAVPATPGPAPAIAAGAEERSEIRARTMLLQAPAGLLGGPELVLPTGDLDGPPVGLGLLGGRTSDRTLLELGRMLAQ